MIEYSRLPCPINVAWIAPVVFGFSKKASSPSAVPDKADDAPRAGWAARLRQGLRRTRESLGRQLGALFAPGARIDEALYEELETILLTADAGVEATAFLLDSLRQQARRENLSDASQLQAALRTALLELLAPLEKPLDTRTHKPFVIMLAGVNGAGKTTTIGKLAKFYQQQGQSILLAAGDTFRAAAREQLAAWGERNDVAVIAQQNADPAAVIHDAFSAASARNIDILLADTAGRLPTQLHLMDELRKIKRVIQKLDPDAPHEVLLVLDATSGQNALAQVKAFDAALGVTGLVLTKLDGTARGGIIAAIARTLPRPVRFIGVGEQLDDLRPFSAIEFIDALLDGAAP